MTPEPKRVVYDCNILLGAMLSTKGAAYQCKQVVDDRRVALFVSPFVLQKLRETPHHPDLKKFKFLTPARVDAYIADLLKKATLIQDVPVVFEYPRDPDDAHYVNLALAVKAIYVVSRDNDLLDLSNPLKPAASEFKQRFPDLRIVEPRTFLSEIAGETHPKKDPP